MPSSPNAVHPRVCGEQGGHGGVGLCRRGSSPRVRGTVKPDCVAHRLLRFIPACAGNSRICAGNGRAAAVHPRVCGEQRASPSLRVMRTGSSPRVRGTDGVARQPCAGERFIPACAGNSPGSRVRRAGRTVHPRVCGEQTEEDGGALSSIGSSPRVRGTAACHSHNPGQFRFIPACAGNSFGLWRQRTLQSVHPRVCGEQSGRPLLAGT